MSHFARVENGFVAQVIVAEQDFVDKQPGKWVQTSYNTRAGVNSRGGLALRKNYAGIGYVYDEKRDAFYALQPYKSWALDEKTCQWTPPVAMPTKGFWSWDEKTLSWLERKAL